MKLNSFLIAFLCAFCAACTAPAPEAPVKAGSAGLSLPASLPEETSARLAHIAEIERAGGFFQGLGLAESGLRERAGDHAGAAVAAYKELAWAYAFGAASAEQVEEGLQNALALYADEETEAGRKAGAAALRGCLVFSRGSWAEAEEFLAAITGSTEEPDSFLNWMLLVCSLERKTSEGALSSYGAIRARYAQFPEYWYRGARAFSTGQDGGGSIAALYAEQCINASPQGPYARECRSILEDHLGLSKEGRTLSELRTKAEIENIIRSSVSSNDPQKLKELFPLMALPDNPYTLYALGALQALSTIPEFKAFFAVSALESQGRLGERLNYIFRS